MIKREILLKLLSIIGTETFPVAEDIITLIKNNQITDEMIDSLYLFFQNTLHHTQNNIQKAKVQK
jgi:hypothetical protein